MRMGRLDAMPALDRTDLLAPAVAVALADLGDKLPADAVGVAEIDPELADTAAFCERYGVAPEESANCVVVAGRRDGETRFAACVVLATTGASRSGRSRAGTASRRPMLMFTRTSLPDPVADPLSGAPRPGPGRSGVSRPEVAGGNRLVKSGRRAEPAGRGPRVRR